ncbi:zinc-binding dehydrogenase [Aeromicrobium sp. Sec7.5]|uniref:zinc-binding dehydrogenase n=1 Tax=Aeromicrobium sp. Sec7.5 TaxID=3121276 RepID=UPI002FE4B307
MRAIRHHEFGPPDVLVLEEVPDPRPAPGQLRVQVEAVGVHLLDTSIRSGESFGPMARPDLPTVPGREVAGTVDAVGEGVSAAWLGRRVVAHLGPTGGGYAEQAVVAADRAHAIPAGLTAELAVAAIGTGRTATAILDLAELGPGDVVAVTAAAGGLGVLLVQAAVAAGAQVVGLAGGPAKVELVRTLGAQVTVDYLADGWVDLVPEPTIVLDAVNGPVGQALYERLAPGGRIVRYGWSSGEENAYDDPDRPVVDVLGPTLLARLPQLERESLDAAADGSRVPLVTTFPLAGAAAAHRALQERRTTGKVVLAVGAER